MKEILWSFVERRSRLFVKSLSAADFRNYSRLSIEFDPGTNILYGNNAQGKTNILEAMYVAASTKSHRGAKDRDMIRIGAEEGHIRMLLDRRGNEYRIDLHLRRNKGKGIAVGGIPVRKAADLFGIASFVLFSPEDLNIVKSGPAGRRKLVDQILCGIDRIYMSDLTDYGKCLKERGALLQELSFRPDRMGELDIWDMQLAAVGSRIIQRRKEFLGSFSEIVSEKHAALSGGSEQLSISYEPSTEAEDFEEKLKKNREKDLKMRVTGTGPHRDDLCIAVGDMDLRTYGSQGQQRTAALSMKMAEIAEMEHFRKEMPVLLLDDVLSELDSNRQNALLSVISSTQTVITCTGLDEFVQNKFRADRIFHVVNGTIES